MSMQSVTQVTPTAVEAQGKAFVDFVKRYTITPADLTAGVVKFPIQAGLTILSVRATVETLFDGTTPTAKVGDSVSDAGFIAAVSLSLATAGTFVQSALASAKHYIVGNALSVTVAGSPTVGKLFVDVVYAGMGTGPERGEISNLS